MDLVKAHGEVYNHLFAYADTLVLRSAVELHIADIIHSHGQPMSITQIASKLESSPSPNIPYLTRVMRVLARNKIFTVENKKENINITPLYGLTETAKCLLHDQELSFAPTLLTFTDPSIMAGWYEIGRTIKEGGTPFVKAHGESFWEMTRENPEFNKLFSSGMSAVTKPALDAIIKGFKDEFSRLEGSLVDVGGGTGYLVANIVEAYPHIKGVNFDLPQTIVNAPQYPGVTHVGGDMFDRIPPADNVIIKSVLHDWGDEEALIILKKCQEAVAQKKGKVIIVEIVLHPDRHLMSDNAAIAIDLLMMVNCGGAKERTEDEWKILLNKAGFTHFNFIPLQATLSFSIIEAFN
ncbi:(R,S)-reticuline 7-O-methyltransferase-like [Spinacia oleracea]|uniref:(R,S)-reticuline 7-O-methyltransferase-like n=1 Tax=Spinacia oleracea TaxID=3562 RepID=A0A9R0KDH0_SPIOL|nr:(R,S)-reticuline 7-O-methyltransferase-like [Spinacia oleracea]